MNGQLRTLALLLCVVNCHAFSSEKIEIAKANDNRTAAGVLKDGTLTLNLEIREARFAPDADDGSNTVVWAFAEAGHVAQIPGPLVRVPQGTSLRITVSNRLSKTVYVHGLYERPADGKQQLEIPAGQAKEVRFQAGAPGTYFYWASTKDCLIDDRDTEDTQLSGAIVIDKPKETPQDRLFVIGLWYADPDNSNAREVLTVNGKSWPFTEQSSLRVGETVDWRWINPSVSDHAMHLHGFYFDVDSVGTEGRDDIYPDEKRSRVVTQYILPGGTFRMHWKPERPGNWLFHCHMIAHMSPHDPMNLIDGKLGPEEHHMGDAGMGGLVLGIKVVGADEVPVSSRPAARKLRLVVRERPATDEFVRGYAFDAPDGDEETPTEKLALYGKPLVLTKGEPVEITVTNKLKMPTSVHWHGIELESYYDGVPGWTGDSRQATPPIAPGESFVARMTPPRAGTFIYHTHWHDTGQLTGGLYGALIVLEPGQKHDPDTDKVFILARSGTIPGHRNLVVNGVPQPRPTVLRMGRTYRFRFINITTNDADATFSLLDGANPVRWTPVGKDGITFDAAQKTEREAKQNVTVGETYDFEFSPSKPGNLVLVGFVPFELQWVHTPIIVEAAKAK